MRDLADLYLTWGLARREETQAGTRWSMPAVLPLPGDLLPLDAELTKRLDWIRWTMRTGPLVDGLITYLVDDLGEPQEVLTSLDRLAAAPAAMPTISASPSRNSLKPVTPRCIEDRSRPTRNGWRRISASVWS